MSQSQVSQFLSSQIGTNLQIHTMVDDGANAVNLDLPNPHAHEVFSFQIECAPAGDFEFYVTYDGTNFVSARVWDFTNLTHTTSVSAITRSIYSAHISGSRTFRITKNGAPPNTAATIHIRQHKYVGSHLQRTKH